jgi:hypothetical protein
MTDDLLDFGKQAKDIADAANVSVDAVTKLGTFVDNIFGNAVKNGLGLIGDKLAYYRLERAIELQQKVEKRLKEKGIDAKKYIPVSFGLPIFERATIEEDDNLQQLWANLLANSLDPKYGGKITRNFVTILSDIEPIDARILDLVVREYVAIPPDKRDETSPNFLITIASAPSQRLAHHRRRLRWLHRLPRQADPVLTVVGCLDRQASLCSPKVARIVFCFCSHCQHVLMRKEVLACFNP